MLLLQSAYPCDWRRTLILYSLARLGLWYIISCFVLCRLETKINKSSSSPPKKILCTECDYMNFMNKLNYECKPSETHIHIYTLAWIRPHPSLNCVLYFAGCDTLCNRTKLNHLNHKAHCHCSVWRWKNNIWDQTWGASRCGDSFWQSSSQK